MHETRLTVKQLKITWSNCNSRSRSLSPCRQSNLTKCDSVLSVWWKRRDMLTSFPVHARDNTQLTRSAISIAFFCGKYIHNNFSKYSIVIDPFPSLFFEIKKRSKSSKIRWRWMKTSSLLEEWEKKSVFYKEVWMMQMHKFVCNHWLVIDDCKKVPPSSVPGFPE